jgi:hypothetical protein
MFVSPTHLFSKPPKIHGQKCDLCEFAHGKLVAMNHEPLPITYGSNVCLCLPPKSTSRKGYTYLCNGCTHHIDHATGAYKMNLSSRDPRIFRAIQEFSKSFPEAVFVGMTPEHFKKVCFLSC